MWGAWSSVMLGDRNVGIDALKEISRTSGRLRQWAFPLVLQSVSVSSAHGVLQELCTKQEHLSLLTSVEWNSR